MNYEYKLAKQLKDAGFEPRIVMICKKDHECRCDKPDCILFPLNPPSLSELIEACGDRFYGLLQKSGGWLAMSFHEIKNDIASQEEWYGSTPEEAVANLWLAINKKV